MHLAALRGGPREPVEYMHYLRACRPPKPFISDDEAVELFETLCKLAGKAPERS